MNLIIRPTRVLGLGLLALAGILARPAYAEASGLHSGVYEGFLLSVSPDGTVRGMYDMSSESGPNATCQIFITGHAAGANKTSVKAWDFENKSLAGTLEPDDPDVDLSIPKAAENFGGCGMAPAPDDPNGTPLSQIRATSWTGLDQITAAKSYLHAAPDDGRQPRAYVVKGDVLGVLGTAPGWLHVEYVPPTNLTKSVKGWIAASEAAPLTAP